MTTGWGNEQAKNAVRRTLNGGPSGPGRVTIFVIVAACLALGIYGGNLLLSVIAGVATIAAGGALVRAAYDNWAVRRMERRYLADPDRHGDQPPSSESGKGLRGA